MKNKDAPTELPELAETTIRHEWTNPIEKERKKQTEKKLTTQYLDELEQKKLKQLFKKHKRLIGSYQSLVEFKEPVVFLKRRNGKTEIYEDQTKPYFEFQHSDGEKRTIWLNQNQWQMEYGKRDFRYYDLHEDIPVPLPENPIATTEELNIAIEKTLNDIKKWKAEELRATGKLIWTIAISIAVIAGVYILYTLLVKQTPTTPQQIAQNVTNLTNQIAIINT